MNHNLVQVEGFNPSALPGKTWFKGADSTPGTLDDCVAFAELDNGLVAIATTRDEGATPLPFSRSEIAVMVMAAKQGQLDHLTA